MSLSQKYSIVLFGSYKTRVCFSFKNFCSLKGLVNINNFNISWFNFKYSCTRKMGSLVIKRLNKTKIKRSSKRKLAVRKRIKQFIYFTQIKLSVRWEQWISKLLSLHLVQLSFLKRSIQLQRIISKVNDKTSVITITLCSCVKQKIFLEEERLTLTVKTQDMHLKDYGR